MPVPTESAQLPDNVKLGAVHLKVSNLEQSLPVWCGIVGLTLFARDSGKAVLGAGDRELIVLHEAAEHPVPEKAIGLFHVAIHVPKRSDLADAALRLMTSGRRHSGQDHMLSESLYVSDPDGNGIELAFDTPWRGRLDVIDGQPHAVTTEGRSHSLLEPLDLEGLIGEASENRQASARLPAGSFIGHIHFRTSARQRMFDFYSTVVGFRPHVNSAAFKFCDVGTKRRPHTVAFNTWGGEDVPPAPPRSAGVLRYTIELPAGSSLDGLRARLKGAGVKLERDSNGVVEFHDPENNAVRVSAAA